MNFCIRKTCIVLMFILAFMVLYLQYIYLWQVNFSWKSSKTIPDHGKDLKFFQPQYLNLLSENETQRVEAASQILSNRNEIPWWEHVNIADCGENNSVVLVGKVSDNVNSILRNNLSHKIGHCGLRASLQGSRQKVVSFSIYGDNLEYYNGMPYILDDVKTLYPGWNVQIYTNPRKKFDFFCPLLKKFPNLSICDVTSLPAPIGDVSSLNPMLWRSAPLGDDQIERFIVRDSDAKVTNENLKLVIIDQMIPREAAAVQEWAQSGKYVHLMRDHPKHNVLIMGGLFGIYQPPHMKAVFENIREDLFVYDPQNDQYNLERVMPRSFMDENALQHSSFLCTSFGKSVPFPTQRQNGLFVGNPMYRKRYRNNKVDQQCPAECRPEQHQDWLFC